MIELLRNILYVCFVLYIPVGFYLLYNWIAGNNRFVFNNDLEYINPSFHNIMHVVLTFLIGIAFNPLVGYLAMFLYEVTDGIKKWDAAFIERPNKPKVFEKIRSMWLYSNKFSLQDIFVWNLAGMLIAFLFV